MALVMGPIRVTDSQSRPIPNPNGSHALVRRASAPQSATVWACFCPWHRRLLCGVSPMACRSITRTGERECVGYLCPLCSKRKAPRAATGAQARPAREIRRRCACLPRARLFLVVGSRAADFSGGGARLAHKKQARRATRTAGAASCVAALVGLGRAAFRRSFRFTNSAPRPDLRGFDHGPLGSCPPHSRTRPLIFFSISPSRQRRAACVVCSSADVTSLKYRTRNKTRGMWLVGVWG